MVSSARPCSVTIMFLILLTATFSQDRWIFEYSPKIPKSKLSVEIPEAGDQYQPHPSVPQHLRPNNVPELGEEKDSGREPRPTQHLPCHRHEKVAYTCAKGPFLAIRETPEVF